MASTDENSTLELELKKFQGSMKRLRKKHGYSQENLSKIIGVEPSLITAIENGDKYPDSEMIRKIGDALGLSKHVSGTPESIQLLSKIIESISQKMADGLLELLNRQEFSKFCLLKENAKLNTKFEISSYLIFLMDVFVAEKQNEQARKALFNAVTSEIFGSLRSVSATYSEQYYNQKLYARMDQYGEFIREPDTGLEIPRDIKISKALWANLTETLAKKSIFKSKDKQIEILSLAYGVACQELEKNLRIVLSKIFSESNDIRKLTSDEFMRLIEKANVKIG